MEYRSREFHTKILNPYIGLVTKDRQGAIPSYHSLGKYRSGKDIHGTWRGRFEFFFICTPLYFSFCQSRGIGIFWQWGGVSKTKYIWHIMLNSGGGFLEKTFYGGGMDIFWNYTIFGKTMFFGPSRSSKLWIPSVELDWQLKCLYICFLKRHFDVFHKETNLPSKFNVFFFYCTL